MTAKQERAPAARSIGAVEFAEKVLRWVAGSAYHTPIDDFAMGLGAVWLSFCFDHDLNPFDELHGIIAKFPLAEALGTRVPDWAKPPYPEDPLLAAAPALADALETYVADADVSSESYDRVAEEFRRDTGFLAPGKDEAAAVNSGVTHEERSHAWHIWVGKRRRTQLENARAALRAAGRLP